MKSIFAIVLLIPIVSTAKAQLRCLTANQYYKVVNGGEPVKISKKVVFCFNDKYCSFYTPEIGTRTILIEGNTIDTVNGFAKQRFINGESFTNTKGDYSVEINYERKKTVIISFTRFGEAYIIEAPGFIGGIEVAAIGNTTWTKEVAKVNTPVAASEPPAKLKQYLNPIEPAKLSQQILSRINTRGQLIATFLVNFDSNGKLINLSPDRPLPDIYAKDIQAISQAATGLEIPPYSKDGVNYPSYTYIRIDLH